MIFGEKEVPEEDPPQVFFARGAQCPCGRWFVLGLFHSIRHTERRTFPDLCTTCGAEFKEMKVGVVEVTQTWAKQSRFASIELGPRIGTRSFRWKQ